MKRLANPTEIGYPPRREMPNSQDSANLLLPSVRGVADQSKEGSGEQEERTARRKAAEKTGHSQEETRMKKGMEETIAETNGKQRTVRIPGFGVIKQRGRIWHLGYSVNGRWFRESSHSDNEADALKLLKRRWKEVGRGRFIGPQEDKVTVDDLLEGLKLDYQNNNLRSLPDLEGRLRHLREAFGGMRAIDVTEDRIERYKRTRLSEKSKNGQTQPGTVNRELAALKRAFRLGVQQKRIAVAPTIAMLQENPPREGFVEMAEFGAIVNNLPEHLQDFARFAYLTGWRKGEPRSLKWSDVDRGAGRIFLRSENSKNKEPRELPLRGELAGMIERRWRARKIDREDGSTELSDYVFHCGDGRPIGDIRKAWWTACVAAGVGQMVCGRCEQTMTVRRCPRCKIKTKYRGVIFHDFRRSAVRNFDRDGVTQTVAMKITGHKTDSIYQRYRIVSMADIEEALARTEAGNKERNERKIVAMAVAKEAK